MKKMDLPAADAAARMKGYLEKIATGPRMSKDLTEEEAQDALALILEGSVSPVRAGIFLIAARMKLETVAENIGYWRALDKTTVRREVSLEKLLQIADPFDGFNRVPYFGFYTLPVMAALGLPVYGHSTQSLPPKLGITFEDLLVRHYGASSQDSLEQRISLLNKYRFGWISIRHSNPSLENLRAMRVEIVKRPMLATLEKMLMPVKARPGGNFLATGYFHRGYEIPMTAVARLSAFDATLIGNGMEGTTLFGVHKDAHVFIQTAKSDPVEKKLSVRTMFAPQTAARITGAYQDLKKESPSLEFLAEWGETALKTGQGPAAPLIACHAATLCHLLGMFASVQEGFDAARTILETGDCHHRLMKFLEEMR